MVHIIKKMGLGRIAGSALNHASHHQPPIPNRPTKSVGQPSLSAESPYRSQQYWTYGNLRGRPRSLKHNPLDQIVKLHIIHKPTGKEATLLCPGFVLIAGVTLLSDGIFIYHNDFSAISLKTGAATVAPQ